ncbi:hypothetical protein [Enhygromyxa salina]|nr:hypothetical protein [Enhygromyxa salina]
MRCSPRPLLHVLVCLLALLSVACTDETGGTTDENSSTDDGSALPSTVFRIEFDGTSVCGAPVDRVEFATRRINCWDPELPCTVSTDPPWITGTAAACSELDGSMEWQVEVTQTGQYETQLRALSGTSQEGIHCFAGGGAATTKVSNADLDTQASFTLTEAPDQDCANP